jgi:hypothetical protein
LYLRERNLQKVLAWSNEVVSILWNLWHAWGSGEIGETCGTHRRVVKWAGNVARIGEI